MKNKFNYLSTCKFSSFISVLLIAIILTSCKKDDNNNSKTPFVITPEKVAIENQSFDVNQDSDTIEALAYIDAKGDDIFYSITSQSKDSLFRITEDGYLFLDSGKTFNIVETRKHEIGVMVTDSIDTAEAVISINLFVKGDYFVTTWIVNEDNGAITIPINNNVSGYDYNVNWGDGDSEEHLSTSATHNYEKAGKYMVTISGFFPAIHMASSGINRSYLLTIESWGKMQWKTMESAFAEAGNMEHYAIDKPDLTQVENVNNMFRNCKKFNADVNNWDISHLTSLAYMFYGCDSFSCDLNKWDVSNVTDMAYLFAFSGFEGDITNWNVSSVTNMERMFLYCINFNQDIGNWNTLSVTNMELMFIGCKAFNQNLNSWNVSNVESFASMFNGAFEFNQPLKKWNTSKATNMSGMFANTFTFNQALNNWDVSNVNNMYFMFDDARSFNQPLSSWDVSSVEDMKRMFYDAESFNQDLSKWNISNVTNCTGFGKNSGLDEAHLPTLGACSGI